ncbi:MAG: Ldh family oxidoreductase [Candidatus Korobacteraceae bacterium]
MNVSAKCIREQIVAILGAWKMLPHLIDVTADVMVDTDLAGIDSHGIQMLNLYEEKLRQGKLNLQAEPKVIRENAVTALIDAGAGLGHPAAVMAMRLAIEKAAACGIAAVSVTNSHHFGAAGYYAKMAAERGFISMVTSNARTVAVVPTRASTKVFGTNPIAFAAPARRNPPFLLDMATSTVAANKVRLYEFKGKPLPDGWVLDENGRSVRDAAVAGRYIWKGGKGGLTPIGGTPEMCSHKGYGLAMVAQLLGSTLAGGCFPTLEERRGTADGPDHLGHFFLVLDPKAFRPDGAFENDLDEMIDYLHGVSPIDPAEPVLVAGDPELQAREQRLKEGVPITPALADKLRAICQRSGVPFLLEEFQG